MGEAVGIGPEDLLDLQPFREGAPEPVEAAPSLTLGDLEGVEEEILEKTLVMESEPVHPETQVQDAHEVPPEDVPGDTPEDTFDATAGGYSSARDAISKLLGNVPAPEASPERRGFNRTATQMDVEATLDALESTLGGVNAKELGAQPAFPVPELTPAELEPTKPMSSTMKLTHDEIASAMKASSLPTPVPVARPVPGIKPPTLPTTPEADTSLLKLQVGQEIYNNVSLDQVTTWIEQGRVQDFHMVARQFSENWIEAGKVPSLRPVFERVRKQQTPTAQQAQAVLLPSPSETAPIKKSLFGGLFNRG